MRAATLFSGIGAPELAMPSWQWLWHAEIEPFPSAVMAARHPGCVNLGDVLADDFAERAEHAGRPDVLVFGSPCQSFSVAGKRLGLADPRGNLAIVALALVRRLRPAWFVFENVPGLLSSDSGRDFEAFLGAVAESGYSGCWRVLDARYWHLAQRRERVFFVGSLGDWRGPAAVLSFVEGMRGYPEKGGEAGEGIARPIAACPAGGSGYRNDADTADSLIAYACQGTNVGEFGTLRSGNGHLTGGGPFVTHSLRAEGFDIGEDGTGRGTPLVPVNWQQVMQVRRLTPMECERLQGFPDDFTLINWRGKPAADGPRYRALGNSMAVPVLRWLLTRIEAATVAMRAAA